MSRRPLAISVCLILLVGLAVLSLPLTGAVTVQAQAQFGTGWNGQFFNTPDLTGAVVYTQAFPTGLNVNWGTSSPAPGVVNVDGWSARFESVQLFNEGTYEFVVASDDGVRVFIDNVLVLDRFVGRVLTTDRFQQTLTPGTHTLRVEYFDGLDQAALQFQWFQVSSAIGTGTPGFGGGGAGLITGTPGITGCTTTCATVTGVRGLALRTGPYLGASFITTLTQDTSYTVTGRNRDEGIYSWYRLDVGNGRTGWASGRYLTINVDINQVPILGSEFDNLDNAPDIGVMGAPRSVMNIRRRPSQRTARIGSVPWGAPVAIIGRTIQAGTAKWYQIRYEGVTGWIDARWVSVSGEINAIPIR
ncbi:MAG: SH3 domain-containing protein [bacterium]|nr:SH3 domain-containing protein [bacterium]